MELHITQMGGSGAHSINLNAYLNDECCVTSAEILFNCMLGDLTVWCQSDDVSMFGIYCDTFDGEDETGFDLGSETGTDFFQRLYDVARLAWYIKENPYIEEGRIFAVIENVHLTYFDFDDFEKQIEDDYHGEYEDDEEFGRKYLEDTYQELEDHLSYYFDYEAYGRDLFMGGSYSKVTWGGTTYVYSN